MDVTPFLKAIDKMVGMRFGEMETSLPGIVTKVNDDGTVDVLPSIRSMSSSGIIGKYDDAPVLGCQLLTTGNQEFAIDIKPKEGDQVLLLFFSRNADGWKSGGWKKEPSDPKGTGASNLNTAIAVQLCLARPKNRITVETDGKIEIDAQNAIDLTVKGDIEIESTEGKIRMKSDVIISGSLKVEQDVTAMYRTAPVTLATHVHPSAMGPTAIPTPGAPEPETP